MNSQDVRLKRAYYRACHRGTKEMDWMLGRFAGAALETMNHDDLTTFEELIALPEPLIDAMLKGAAHADGSMADMIARIRRHHGMDTPTA
ncbi:MAG: succinate dehydrogenase assembly factor 2 [Chitinophagales bacterium]|nr:succinate dehydrogenase assembly factor 2 [Hyphomicrobiales bacterium]